jgi:hypothetical protein
MLDINLNLQPRSPLTEDFRPAAIAFFETAHFILNNNSIQSLHEFGEKKKETLEVTHELIA